MDKTSLSLGWLVGRQIAGQRRAKPPEPEKEPIGYLYGESWAGPFQSVYGPLPSKEEWDRTEYPCAIMLYPGGFNHYLFVSKEPWYGTGEPYMYTDYRTGVTTQYGETIRNGSAGCYFIDAYDGDGRTIWRRATEEELEGYGEYLDALGQNKDTDGDGRYDYGAEGLINWSNHDILSADGKTVLVTASDPIPVYE